MKTMLGTLLVLSAAAALAQDTPGHAVTTLEQQTDLAVTAYNNGIGLVKDTRELQLPTGTLRLEFQDVAEQIQPATVSLRSLSEAGSITIYEQNYEYDLISPEKLMEKYVGQEVKLFNFSTEVKDFGGSNVQTAKLLSYNNGPVYLVRDEIYLGHPGNVILPKIPENLIAKPTLIWELENAAGQQKIEATYVTNGITWQADYVVTIPKTEQTLDLKGWVTLNNQSGATYTNAQLKLVAGQLNMAPPPMPMDREMKMAIAGAAREAMPVEEAFAEYHLYTMPRRTTVKQNQSKQLALLDAAGVGFTKKYEYRSEPHFYYQFLPPMRDQHVQASIEFQNKAENKVGLPLPAGVMRIYQEDSSGTLQFAGEDRIEHTPKDEKVTLRMGEAFDIVADRIQTDYQVIANNVHESAFEITVRNHKAADVVVDVVENLPGDWRVLEKSMEFEKKDAQTVIFHAPVPKDGEVKVTYRVQVRS
ncbi:MAG: DUF4139 domain-containing protein [Candidatus Hydrogenedentes bacterium]|nr:DUF4139 domain-containing protein [Candidatus Hydrogenedentota bacterium]